MELNNFRQLRRYNGLIDFSSNDYLGFARSDELNLLIKNNEEKYLKLMTPGSGASRLITGNHELYDIVEKKLSEFYNAEKVLIFNSGYDANVGLFSSICTKDDTILYDEFIHASIRDGIRLSHARSFSFRHNDLESLKEKLNHARGNIIVAIESVYSMEGIKKNNVNGIEKYIFEEIIDFCHDNDLYVMVDEAHSTGVYGKNGEGLVIDRNLQNKVFARIHTFGKALGVHGAAVVCSNLLYDYLVNFARSFIYTTALPPHSLLSILTSHEYLNNLGSNHFLSTNQQLNLNNPRNQLKENINYFKKIFYNQQNEQRLDHGNDSAIHAILVPGIDNAKKIANLCINSGIDVRAILSPTVPAGKETLRICLHSFNSKEEIEKLVSILQ
ncbi:MAG: pyridoxal phosphate-dependent aminotransferase family protein [Spirochaetia bacterium]|nr:pyridoxal phosphate-dependent aminotransferase family protein [Spirochaetia bacterium]